MAKSKITGKKQAITNPLVPHGKPSRGSNFSSKTPKSSEKKKPAKKQAKQPNQVQRKKNRWRPGTVALREIRKAQKQFGVCAIPKTRMLAALKGSLCDISNCNYAGFDVKHSEQCKTQNIRFGRHAIEALQEALEFYAADYLQDANRLAIHAKRVTVGEKDFTLLGWLKNPKPLDERPTGKKPESKYNFKHREQKELFMLK